MSDSIFIKMKRFITIFMLAILIPCIMSAQQQTEVYRSVEQMPRYPDGEAELMKYIMANINFPETCAEGIVVAQFVVEADGRIGEVKVVRSIDQLLDEEAVRVIKFFAQFCSRISQWPACRCMVHYPRQIQPSPSRRMSCLSFHP